MTQVTIQALKELVDQRYDADLPSSNCVKHKNVKITDRSIDCPMCAADMRDMLRACLAANQWLCQWQETAIKQIYHLGEAKTAPSPEPKEERTLRSEADASITSALPLKSKNGSVLTVDSLEKSVQSEDYDMLTLARIWPEAEAEQIKFVRVNKPTRKCAELAVEILREFVQKTD